MRKDLKAKKINPNLLIIAIAALLGIVGYAIKPRMEKARPIPADTVRLNKVIRNSLSDSLGLEKMEAKIKNYMAQWGLKGVNVTMMRNDSLLYSKGFGWADEEKEEVMEANTLLRVASVSKLITAAGIMKLCDEGKMSLADTVFGPSGILNDTIYTSSIKDKNYYKITVEHLLRHQGGFSQRGGDPMFSTRSIMINNKLTTPPDHEDLVRIQLRRRLHFMPGKSQEYSNFGYLLLSMIIEKVTGMPYEEYMQKNVLLPAGCFDMHIANNYYNDRHKNETRYYVPVNEEPIEEYNNSGNLVERCYGGNDIRALSGAGAWVTSGPELARFVASIDGKPMVRDILTAESVAEMTRYIDKNTYSLGWNDTKPDEGWVRTGTFSGTSALIKYYPDGECWIFISNTSTWKGPSLARYTTALFSELRRRFSDKMPDRNLFEYNGK